MDHNTLETASLYAAIRAEIAEFLGGFNMNAEGVYTHARDMRMDFRTTLAAFWFAAQVYSLRGARWDDMLNYAEPDTDEIRADNPARGVKSVERLVKWWGLDGKRWELSAAHIVTSDRAASYHVTLFRGCDIVASRMLYMSAAS